MLQNLKIGQRLLAGFFFLALVMLGMSVVNAMGLRSIKANLDSLYADRTVPLEQLGKVQGSLLRSRGDLFLALEAPQEVERVQAGIREQLALADKEWKDYIETFLVQEEKDGIAVFNPGWETYKQEVGAVLEKIRTRRFDEARSSLVGGRAQAALATCQGALVRLMDIQIREADGLKKQVDSTYGRLNLTALVVTGAALLFAAVAGLTLTRSITRPLFRFREVLARVSEGDLTLTCGLKTRDELGEMSEALDGTVRHLKEAILQVQEAATAISGASSEISQGNADLSRRTEQQAANLQETASSLEQISSTVNQTADNATSANREVARAREVAQEGGVAVAQVVAAMEAINTSSARISEIIGVVDEIAFQTNLLALNAAVEAARAGEQGRGFAVVAAEVRNLAKRSAGAAKEIKQLIRESVSRSEDGNRVAAQAGATIQEVVANVQRVTSLVSDMARATREQSAGLAEVNKAVSEIDGATQQNAALVEESAATAASLDDQARGLAEVVGRFNTGAPSRLGPPRLKTLSVRSGIRR